MINLGKEAQDKITGFMGIIVAKITYLTGCDQYGLAPLIHDGKVESTAYFDTPRIEIIGEGVSVKEVVGTVAGGINRDAPSS